jgi:hypothetical protein
VSVAVVRRRRSHGTSLTVLGPAASELVEAVLPGLRTADTDPSVRVGALTVPRATEADVAGRLALRAGRGGALGVDVDAQPPGPVPGEGAVRELDVADRGEAARIGAFLRAYSPLHSTTPDGDPAGPGSASSAVTVPCSRAAPGRRWPQACPCSPRSPSHRPPEDGAWVPR